MNGFRPFAPFQGPQIASREFRYIALMEHPLPPPTFTDPADFACLREALLNADYSTSGIVSAMRIKNFEAIRTAGRPVMLDRTSAGRPIDAFIRLFLLRVPVSREQITKAIAPLSFDSFAASRLIVPGENAGEFISGFDMLPFEGFILTFDRPPREGNEPYTDYVMGIGGSTTSLGMQMVRRRSRATLDLGCGCGTLGFLATKFSDRVIGADRNQRALAIARFNVALNAVTNYDIVETDFFSAVQGRKFDLIVSNPPFVISPGKKFIYRDGGMQGDGVTETVVRGCCEHLAEGGFAHILCNWAHMKDQPWDQRLAAWARGGDGRTGNSGGADMLVLRTITRDPVEYAMQWISETERYLTTEQMWTRLNEWVDAYKDQGIEAVSGGLISLHKSGDRPGWFDADTSPEQGAGYTGEHLAQMFAARDFLHAIGGEAGLPHRRLRCSPQLRLSQHVQLTPEGWQLVEAEARIDPGYPFGGVLEPLVMQFVLRMEGRETVAEAINAVAAENGRDVAQIAPRALPIVAHLVRRAVLLPVG